MSWDTIKTSVQVNGETVYSSRYSFGCCPMLPPMLPPVPMFSCFGFGFAGCCRPSFGSGLAMGLGFGLGAALGKGLDNLLA